MAAASSTNRRSRASWPVSSCHWRCSRCDSTASHLFPTGRVHCHHIRMTGYPATETAGYSLHRRPTIRATRRAVLVTLPGHRPELRNTALPVPVRAWIRRSVCSAGCSSATSSSLSTRPVPEDTSTSLVTPVPMPIRRSPEPVFSSSVPDRASATAIVPLPVRANTSPVTSPNHVAAEPVTTLADPDTPETSTAPLLLRTVRSSRTVPSRTYPEPVRARHRSLLPASTTPPEPVDVSQRPAVPVTVMSPALEVPDRSDPAGAWMVALNATPRSGQTSGAWTTIVRPDCSTRAWARASAGSPRHWVRVPNCS